MDKVSTPTSPSVRLRKPDSVGWASLCWDSGKGPADYLLRHARVGPRFCVCHIIVAVSAVQIHSVTADRREDLVALFGENGGYANCWCTWFLLSGRQFDETSPTERRAILLDQVDDGLEPGLLAYRNGVAVGWCAVGPRERYGRMTSPRARTYKPVDDQSSWVVSCFYIDRQHRNSGVASALLAAATDHARNRGATLVEGYPWDRPFKDDSWGTMFVGTLKMFESAGFETVERRGDRAVVRLGLDN